MKKPTVWVIKEQVVQRATGSEAMDYSAAYQYGDVRFITESDLPLHPDSTVAKVWFTDVMKFIKALDVENDYVVLTGQPLAIYMVGALLGGLQRCPKILVWRREQGRYVVYDPLAMVEASPIPIY